MRVNISTTCRDMVVGKAQACPPYEASYDAGLGIRPAAKSVA